MNYMNEDTASVNVKRKNISMLIEYCIENKIEFTVKPLLSRSEEFEIEFILPTAKKAIALGMCLRELKIELNGLQPAPVAAVNGKSTAKKASPVAKTTTLTNGHSKEESVTPISFEEEKLEFNLETAN